MADPVAPAGIRRKYKGPAKLGTLVPNAVGPVFSRRGFASTDLAVHWPHIVGKALARHTRLLQMQWPKNGGETAGVGATLVIAAHGAIALDLQQQAAVILERVNQRLGWRCATRLAIRQMPITLAEAPVRPEPPGPEDHAAASRIAAGIASDTLRQSLIRLGAAALARQRRGKRQG